MRQPPPNPSRGDFHVDTLRFLADQARRELDADDGRARRANVPVGARERRLQRAAQVTQERFAAAQARRRSRPPR